LAKMYKLTPVSVQTFENDPHTEM